MAESSKQTPDLAATPDPFNLDALRAPPNFQQTGGVKKTTLNVNASSRPPKDKFIRVHPFDATHGQEDWCLNVVVFGHQFEDEISAENFIVPSGSDVYDALFEKLRPALIICGITTSAAKFLWELKLPSPGNNRRANQWHETRLVCARKAMDGWLRPEADMHAGGYNYAEPIATIPDPDWGNDSFQTMFQIAYRERIIDSLDHPVAKEVLGG